jgi:hypothetical protein
MGLKDLRDKLWGVGGFVQGGIVKGEPDELAPYDTSYDPANDTLLVKTATGSHIMDAGTYSGNPNPFANAAIRRANASGSFNIPVRPEPAATTNIEDRSWREYMINMRMQWGPYEKPFRDFATTLSNEAVHVHIITNSGKAVTLEDGRDLFPSDTLVTQLRLILG